MSLSHLVILIVVLVLVFGSAKLPEIARNIGKSAKTLKSEMRDMTAPPDSAPAPREATDE